MTSGLCLAVWFMLDRFVVGPRRQFGSASGQLALGSPSVPVQSDVDQQTRYVAEFRAIEGMFQAHKLDIANAQNEFDLLRSLRVVSDRHQQRLIARPTGLLRCSTLLGESVAGAGYFPGSVLYWMEIQGRALSEAIASDITILEDVATGRSRTLQSGHLRIELSLEVVSVTDLRDGGLGSLKMTVGTPILLRLDDISEKAMRLALGTKAPPIGASNKVRLFGGLRINSTRQTLQIVPLRQEPGMDKPEVGRLHDLSGLLGIVVAQSASPAFDWQQGAAKNVAEVVLPTSSVH